jgi:hypothetical protein
MTARMRAFLQVAPTVLVVSGSWSVTRLRHSAALLIIVCLFFGCYDYEVNTFQAWCERLTEINDGNHPDETHRPFWAIIYSVRIDRDKIRDDFVKFLNDGYEEKVQKRAPRIVWREGKVLHVVSLSSFFVEEPGEFIADWKKGITKAQSLQKMNDTDNCLWNTVFLLFDSVQIHLFSTDPGQHYWGDSVTAIPTDRKKVGEKNLTHVYDVDGWYLMVPALVEGPVIYPACQHGLITDRKSSLVQWNIEGSFDSTKECETILKQARKSGAVMAAKAAQVVSGYRKESPGEWSWSLPLCSSVARGMQLSEAICVSTDDPRLKEK